MFCRNCGKDIGDSRFCPFCGEDSRKDTANENAIQTTLNAQPSSNEVESNSKIAFNSTKEALDEVFKKQPSVLKIALVAVAAVCYLIVTFLCLLPLLREGTGLPLDWVTPFVIPAAAVAVIGFIAICIAGFFSQKICANALGKMNIDIKKTIQNDVSKNKNNIRNLLSLNLLSKRPRFFVFFVIQTILQTINSAYFAILAGAFALVGFGGLLVIFAFLPVWVNLEIIDIILRVIFNSCAKKQYYSEA